MYLCLDRVPAINHEPRKQASTDMYRSSRRVDMSQASVFFKATTTTPKTPIRRGWWKATMTITGHW